MNMDLTFGQRNEASNLIPSIFSLFGPFEDREDPMFPVNL